MIHENVRQDLLALVPSSILGEIKCFVFYDNHPRGDRQIDILVCTERKEVIEFYKREQISSLLLNTSNNFREVRSFRNVNCELYYFVATKDELFILLSRNDLKLVHRITEVDSFEVFDPGCIGQACLKVICKDDAMPVLYDDNFKIINETSNEVAVEQSDDSSPVIIQLSRKLKEIEYNIKCNENKYNECLSLRKRATFHLYQKIAPNLNECLFNLNTKEIASSLKLKTWTPWIKLCNRKIVVAFNLLNSNNVLLENVYVLLNCANKKSLVYVTRLFHQIQNQWFEIEYKQVKANTLVTVVTCIDLKELQNEVTSGLDFDIVLVFKKLGQNYILPFDKVSISASDVMEENLNVLANYRDEQQTFLSVLATSEKITLLVRNIKNKDNLTLADIFSKYLKMEQFKTIKNTFIHKSSPYHALHGVMVILQNGEQDCGDKFTIEVHSRCPSQIASLIHYINDIPFRIIITTPNYKITSKTKELSYYNEEINENVRTMDYKQLATSALTQTSMLLEYFDMCMIKMNMSHNQEILNKVGSEIDLFACGLDKFTEFRNKLINEVFTGINECRQIDNSIQISQDTVDIIDEEEMKCFSVK